MMMISRESRSAIEITGILIHVCAFIFYILFTVHSFLELVPFVFTIPGVKEFLSNRICQDPWKSTLGCNARLESLMTIPLY